MTRKITTTFQISPFAREIIVAVVAVLAEFEAETGSDSVTKLAQINADSR